MFNILLNKFKRPADAKQPQCKYNDMREWEESSDNMIKKNALFWITFWVIFKNHSFFKHVAFISTISVVFWKFLACHFWLL